jgi:outer membrane protein assembly factor BamB
MYGYDPGNSNAHPGGTSLEANPGKEKSVLESDISAEDVAYRNIGPPDASGPDYPPGPPVVDGTMLYFLFAGDLIAYDFEQEAEQWRVESDSDNDAAPSYLWYGPCLCEKEIAVTDFFTVYFIDRTTGEIAGECELVSPHFANAVVCGKSAHHPNGLVQSDRFVYSIAGTLLFAIERKKKTIAWRFGHSRIEGRPLVSDKHVIVSSSDDIYGIDLSTGFVAWIKSRQTNYGTFIPALVHEGKLIGTAGNKLIALDATTGERNWLYSFEFPTGGARQTPWACAADGKLFAVALCQQPTDELANEYGLVSIAVADGTEHWQRTSKIQIPDDDDWPVDVGVSRPVLSGESIIVESGTTPQYLLTDGGVGPDNQSPYYTGFAGIGSGTLRVFDFDSGDQRWHCSLNDRVTSLVATSERVYVGMSSGTFHSFVEDETDNKDTTESQTIAFCPNCGTNVEQYEQPQYCPDCGERLKI